MGARRRAALAGLWLGLWLALGGPTVAASSGWYEARTDHFRIFLQGTPQSVADYATNLERFDKAMRVVRDIPEREGERANPLVVYVVPDASAVQRLCAGGRRKRGSCANTMGFFVPHLGESTAYTPRRSGDGGTFDLGARTVLFHEYAHHFLFGSAAAAYPAWFSEGFAEFNATTDFGKDGTVNVGKPPLYRGYSLMAGVQLPIERLLSASVASLPPQYRESLYARGWLLTHYLTFDKPRAGQLSRYLKAINDGQPSLEAARGAFGDLKKLNADLDRYLNVRLTYIPLKPDMVKIGTPAVRPLSAGEIAMLPVVWRSNRGVDATEAAAVVIEARRLAAPFANDSATQNALAEAEYDAGNDDLAEAAADRALAVDAKDRTAMMYKGRARMRRTLKTARGDTPAWREARGWFIKANRLEPDDATPLALFYQSFLAANVKPTANAVIGLERAFVLSPQAEEVRFLLARQYLMDDKPAEARVVLAPLAFDPHAGPDNFAAKLVALIDAKDKPGIRTALTGPAPVAVD